MEQNLSFWIEKLKELIGLLASEPTVQTKYLEKLGTSPSTDELSLELDDLLWVLEPGLEKGILSHQFVDVVKSISMNFDEMSKSDNKLLWDVKSLREAKEWKDIRESAKSALREKQRGHPNNPCQAKNKTL